MGRKDSKITDKLRKVLVCILMIAGLGVVVYILMPMGDMNLTGIIETSNGGKYGKRVSFLVDYVKSTGNLEIATGIGITEEDLNNFMGGDSTMFDSIFVKDTVAGIGISEGTKEEVLTSYRDSNPDLKEFYGNTKWNIVEASGKTYMYEVQGAGNDYYENEKLGGDYSVESQGCFLFAIAAAATNMSGELVTVRDLINAGADSKVGSGERVDSFLKKWSAKNPDKVQLHCPIQYTTPDSSKYYPEGTSKLAQHIQDGKIAIVYANECNKQENDCGSSTHEPEFATTTKKLSGSGHHWLTIVGIEGTDYIVLCNGSRSSRVNMDYVHKHITGFYVVEEQ